MMTAATEEKIIDDNEMQLLSAMSIDAMAELPVYKAYAWKELEKNFDVIKNHKNLIKENTDLKIRLEILKNRLDDLVENL